MADWLADSLIHSLARSLTCLLIHSVRTTTAHFNVYTEINFFSTDFVVSNLCAGAMEQDLFVKWKSIEVMSE